jgi:putative colanic acid biosynthesis acetyltransferase WcaF
MERPIPQPPRRPRTVLGRALRPSYAIGASLPKRAAWYVVNLAVLYNPWMPLSAPRVWALRAFGARVGRDVNIKPHVKVKFPWKLRVGDGAAIGEECWIDNLDDVSIGRGTLLSQRSYLCTGNHAWSTHDLPLRTAPIRIGDHAWVGAGVVVGPGADIGDGTIVTVGSVALGSLPANSICAGNPATVTKPRFPGPVR